MSTVAEASVVDAWQEWHAQVEHDRGGPHGSLAATGLHWLGADPAAYPDAPGLWWRDGEVPVVDLAEGETLTLSDGSVARGRIRFEGIPLDHSVYAFHGETALEIGERAGELILRPRVPANPARLAYAGTATFPYDPAFVVRARFTPTPGAQAETDAVTPRIRHVIPVAGTAEFEVAGVPVRATVFHHKDGVLYRILFRDLTGGELTYAASRNLLIDPSLGGEGELILDFNRTWNLPCAYAPYWTCALPPAQNVLPVRIEAGELAPGQSLPVIPDVDAITADSFRSSAS